MAVRKARISLRRFHHLLLSVIDFSPSARAFFVRMGFLRIWTVPAVSVVLRRIGEFPLSLKEELGRSRILRSLYSNGHRNQRVNYDCLDISKGNDEFKIKIILVSP
ncbi:hypothetical protein AVEN_222020-1 [Araneus ventricosus]|uniref:Uncharacterized protein n=1 Tax=Araneus ventricosus TaxID=182803 RepID=A0A4Y2LHB4_ARAVE|nr:hypothetical protein AVEN_222020-1 [Araneus ventricosus]